MILFSTSCVEQVKKLKIVSLLLNIILTTLWLIFIVQLLEKHSYRFLKNTAVSESN